MPGVLVVLTQQSESADLSPCGGTLKYTEDPQYLLLCATGAKVWLPLEFVLFKEEFKTNKQNPQTH